MTIYHDLALSKIDPIARENLVILVKGVGTQNYVADLHAPMRSLFANEWLYKNFLEGCEKSMWLEGATQKLYDNENSSIQSLISEFIAVNSTPNREVTLMYPHVADTKTFYSIHTRKKLEFGEGKYADLAPDDEEEILKFVGSGEKGAVPYDFYNYWNARAKDHLKMDENTIYAFHRQLLFTKPGKIAFTKRRDGLASIILPSVYIFRHHNLWIPKVTGKVYPHQFEVPKT